MCMDRQTGLNEIRDSNAVCSWGSHREKECGTEPRSTCQHVERAIHCRRSSVAASNFQAGNEGEKRTPQPKG